MRRSDQETQSSPGTIATAAANDPRRPMAVGVSPLRSKYRTMKGVTDPAAAKYIR
jgi:hypothetical protein